MKFLTPVNTTTAGYLSLAPKNAEFFQKCLTSLHCYYDDLTFAATGGKMAPIDDPYVMKHMSLLSPPPKKKHN